MTQAKFSPWYSAKKFHPMHVGWYDYKGVGIYQCRAFWTGKKWLWTPKGDDVHGMWVCRGDEWRGLAEKPK